MPELLLEIGVEELPVGYFSKFEEGFILLLMKGLPEGTPPPSFHYTPRRLVLHWSSVPPMILGEEKEVKGPPRIAAFGKDGSPTPALTGFLAKNCATDDQLVYREVKGREYCVLNLREPDRPFGEVFAEALISALDKFAFPKNMRWTDTDKTFARPIRWFLCLLGEEVVPFEWNGVTSGRVTYGHLILSKEPLTIVSASLTDFEKALENGYVILRKDNRSAMFDEQARRVASDSSFQYIPTVGLSDIIVDMVEYPNVVLGELDSKFMALPECVMRNTLAHHQYSVLLYEKGSEATPVPAFVAACNIPGRQEELAEVRKGNENVCRARLEDALFFFNEDRKRSLASRVPELAGVVFHQKLGDYLQKTERLVRLCKVLAEQGGLGVEQENLLLRAAHLSRADLLTHIVFEMPELQGTMGKIYAKNDGEDSAVAAAIEEMYLPTSKLPIPPKSLTGAYLAMADRLDTLCAFFAADIKPSSSKDPFGLRRAAFGVVEICNREGFLKDLRPLITEAARLTAPLVPGADATQVAQDVEEFILERIWSYMMEGGCPRDLCEAVHAVTADRTRPLDIRDAFVRYDALEKMAKDPRFSSLCTTLERAANITKDFSPKVKPDPGLAKEPAEVALFEVFERTEGRVASSLSRQDAQGYDEAAWAFVSAFSEPLHRFFEEVFVNVNDEQIRDNRKSLLKAIYLLLARDFADLTKVSAKR
ncbi:MAG: glycine--tRNA ligase subunit beta [Planctomycetota bacterium]